MVAAVPLLSFIVIKSYPENYAWQIEQAMKSGEVDRAVAIARTRVSTESYDFTAKRLLARALISDDNATGAVDTMLGSLEGARSVPQRDVFSIGFDPAADYALLSEALTAQGRVAFAEEMARVADDHRRMAHGSLAEFDTTTPLTAFTSAPPQDGGVVIDLSAFAKSAGIIKTPAGTLHFSRNASTSATLPHGQSAGGTLAVQVRGGLAMGMGGILVLVCNGAELIRIYANTAEPRWIFVPLPAHLSEENLKLTMELVNDAYDPISKADRNVELMQLQIL